MRLYHNLPVIGETTEVIFSMISWLTGAALIASAMLVYPLALAFTTTFSTSTEIEINFKPLYLLLMIDNLSDLDP